MELLVFVRIITIVAGSILAGGFVVFFHEWIAEDSWAKKIRMLALMGFGASTAIQQAFLFHERAPFTFHRLPLQLVCCLLGIYGLYDPLVRYRLRTRFSGVSGLPGNDTGKK